MKRTFVWRPLLSSALHEKQIKRSQCVCVCVDTRAGLLTLCAEMIFISPGAYLCVCRAARRDCRVLGYKLGKVSLSRRHGDRVTPADDLVSPCISEVRVRRNRFHPHITVSNLATSSLYLLSTSVIHLVLTPAVLKIQLFL